MYHRPEHTFQARGTLLDSDNRRKTPAVPSVLQGPPPIPAPPISNSPPPSTPPTGTPLLSPRNLPRPNTPSTGTPPHSGTPPPGATPPFPTGHLDALSPSRKNSLLPPGTDSRRSSLTKKSLTDLAQDARKGIKNVKDTSMKAGQKVKDKTVSVSGQMKDATVGASQWVASQTSKTAKMAMEQAKSGMSFGEKFTLYTVEKISTFSRKGFTHVFMFLILAIYTALGALLFIAIEGPHENEEKNDIENERNRLLENLWEHHTMNKGLNNARWKAMATSLLKRYDEQLYHSWSVGISPDTDDRIWTFWKTMFFCSTITTTIGYGHIFPRTDAGKALTIVYAILGIPIFLILMADFGKLFTRLLKAVFILVRRINRSATCTRVKKSHAVQVVKEGWRKASQWCSTTICRRNREADTDETPESEDYVQLVDDNFNLPISLALFILLVYIMIGCVLYTMWESWTYFEAFYFIFISMTTIGFGDYVPDHPAFMMMTTVYLVFGLALTAMCINIIQEKMTDTFRKATEKMKQSIQQMMNNAAQGEDGGDLPEGKEVEVAKVHGAKKPTAPPSDL